MVAAAKKTAAPDQTTDQRPADLQMKTLLGDVRDGILREFKGLEKPWQRMTETEQARVIHRAADIAERVVRGAIDIAATRGFEHFDVQLGKITVDKTVELKVTAPFSAEIIAALSTRRGDTLVMIARDAGEFRGERKPAKPTNVGELAIPHGENDEDDIDQDDEDGFDEGDDEDGIEDTDFSAETVDPTTGEVAAAPPAPDTEFEPDDENAVMRRRSPPRPDEEHLAHVGRGRKPKGSDAAAQA